MSSDLPLVLLSWPLEGREHLLTDPALKSSRLIYLDMFGKGLGRYECNRARRVDISVLYT